MIRVALISAALVVHFAPFVQAVGVVDFANDRNFRIPADRLVRDVSGIPLLGTNYFAQLYYGPLDADPSSLDPVASPPARFRPPTHTLPGTWAGGNRTLWGYVAGDMVTLQVRVWDGTVADSYEQARAQDFGGTQHGVSEPFSYWVPELGGSFDSYIENFRGFTLVPEPSLALLVIIGIVGLYFARKSRG
jgi:hypothetical protein